MPDVLKPFAPSFEGTMKVETAEDEEGYIMEIKEEEDMKMSMQKEIKWGTMIPLVGGSALGCERAAGNLPQYHLTFGPFANNEAHLRNHWADHQV